jgi:hypothetical protein
MIKRNVDAREGGRTTVEKKGDIAQNFARRLAHYV